jgi:hypothetical protein
VQEGTTVPASAASRKAPSGRDPAHAVVGIGNLAAEQLRGAYARWLLARVAVTITIAATAPIDSRSRRNAEAAVALDRIRAGDRLAAGARSSG